MEIKQIIETDEGNVEFHGVLSGIELQAVITVGLNSLVQAGALPIIATDETNMAQIAPWDGETQ